MKKWIMRSIFVLTLFFLATLGILRYQQVNHSIAKPAVEIRKLNLPAQLALNDQSVEVQQIKPRNINGKWQIRMYFKPSIQKKDLERVRIMLLQKRDHHEMRNEQKPLLSRKGDYLEISDAYYSAKKYDELAIITLPREKSTPNEIQTISLYQ